MYIVAPTVYFYVGKMKSIPKIALITFLMTAIIIDFGYSKPQKLYTCICCRNFFPASDMISYNNASLVGQCRSCNNLYGGVIS